MAYSVIVFSKCTEVKLFIYVRLPDLASSHVPASKLRDGQASHVTGQYSDTGSKQAFVDAKAVYSAIAWGRLMLVMPLSSLSTQPSISNSSLLVSMSFHSALHGLSFVIASAGFLSPRIQRISDISLRSYDCRRHIKSTISRFSCIVPSLTRHSYSDFESMQIVSGMLPWRRQARIWFKVDLIVEAVSKPRESAYNSEAKTLLVTHRHLTDCQWMIFALLCASASVIM